jgi:hypothetical protein
MAQQERMTMVEFFKRFGTERSCREHLYKKRWPEGYECPKCGKKSERTISNPITGTNAGIAITKRR